MNKIRYHNEEFNTLGLDAWIYNCNVFIIPEHLDRTFENWLSKHPDEDNKSFRIKHYKIMSELLTDTNRYTHTINDYKIHLEIQKQNFYRTAYEVGKRKSSYFLINNHFEYYVCINTEDKIDKMRRIKEEKIIEKLRNNRTYMNTIANVRLEVPECIEYCITKYKDRPDFAGIMARIYASFSKFSQDFYAKEGKKVERIFSAYTELPKDVKKFLTVNGKHFHEFDIRCAQPTLLAITLQQNGYPIDDNYKTNVYTLYDDIILYAANNNIEYEEIKCTINGRYKVEKFYYNDKNKLYDENRDTVKEICFRSIFFSCKSIASSKTAMIFQKLYPVTYNSLQLLQTKLKSKNSSIATVAQNLEADIMYFAINLINEFFHVHDAIYITNEDEGWAYCNAITEKYKEYVEIRWRHTENKIVKIERNDAIKPLVFTEIDVPSRKSTKGLKHIIKHRNKSPKSATLMDRFKELKSQKKSLKEIATELGIAESYCYHLNGKLKVSMEKL